MGSHSDYQERSLACALIIMNRDTDFLDDFLNIIFNHSNNMTLKLSCLIKHIVKKGEKENIYKFYLKFENVDKCC